MNNHVLLEAYCVDTCVTSYIQHQRVNQTPSTSSVVICVASVMTESVLLCGLMCASVIHKKLLAATKFTNRPLACK